MPKEKTLTEKMKDLGEILKFVVLIETKPLSDIFEQVMLTREQFKQVTALIEKMMPLCEHGNRMITTNDDFTATIPNIPTCYSQAEIDNLK